MKTQVIFETKQDRTLSRRKEFYDDGTLFREGLYSKAQGSWLWDIPIGPVRTYNPNGTIKSEESFDDGGTLDGESLFYDKDGLISRKVLFSKGRKINEQITERPVANQKRR
jgi:antitoxin component YwqK of YwqJK toxin-antitoxin module